MDKTQKFIERAINVHGDKYDYSKTIYKLSTDKVTIICRKHGEFEQRAVNHTFGYGCKKCGMESHSNKIKRSTASFVRKAIKIHGDKYSYEHVDYKSNKVPVTIICKVHGKFNQTPMVHLGGHGCRCCGRDRAGDNLRKDNALFIEEAINVHGDRYVYNRVEYVNTRTRVTIVCKIHGEFEQIPESHLAGYGCTKCTRTYQYTTQEWISRAKEVHGDKYDYSKSKYVNSHTKVVIICRNHGEFSTTGGSHLTGHGCSKCAGNWNYSTAEWIEKAKGTHGDTYDYSETKYVNSETKVTIICKEHGKFEQNPYRHVTGFGCFKCSCIWNYSTSEWIERAKEAHGNTYDYSETEYVDSKTNVTITCKKHGKFEQNPYHHVVGNGCPKCASNWNYSTAEWIEKAKGTHDDTYDYSETKYVNCRTNVIIICKMHGKFEQNPPHHIAGSGCSRCSSRSYSKKAIKCLDYIANRDNISIQHAENNGEFKIPSTRYKADGYCKEKNLIIEFHGDIFHGCPKCKGVDDISPIAHVRYGDLYDKTMVREECIRNIGFNLVAIWEHEWDIVFKRGDKYVYFPDEIKQFSCYELCMLISEKIELCDASSIIKKNMIALGIDFTGFSSHNFHEYDADIRSLFDYIIDDLDIGRNILFLLYGWFDEVVDG